MIRRTLFWMSSGSAWRSPFGGLMRFKWPLELLGSMQNWDVLHKLDIKWRINTVLQSFLSPKIQPRHACTVLHLINLQFIISMSLNRHLVMRHHNQLEIISSWGPSCHDRGTHVPVVEIKTPPCWIENCIQAIGRWAQSVSPPVRARSDDRSSCSGSIVISDQ